MCYRLSQKLSTEDIAMFVNTEGRSEPALSAGSKQPLA
jgi:hypothetical protein